MRDSLPANCGYAAVYLLGTVRVLLGATLIATARGVGAYAGEAGFPANEIEAERWRNIAAGRSTAELQPGKGKLFPSCFGCMPVERLGDVPGVDEVPAFGKPE